MDEKRRVRWARVCYSGNRELRSAAEAQGSRDLGKGVKRRVGCGGRGGKQFLKVVLFCYPVHRDIENTGSKGAIT
jgi:hypothetical protein